MSADDAARAIVRGIAAGKRRIVVPWQFVVIRGADPAAAARAAARASCRAHERGARSWPESGLLARLAASRAGRAATLLLRWGIPLAAAGHHRPPADRTGLAADLGARGPANAGFYLLLVVQFFLQPFGDYLVYRNLWGGHIPPLAVILRKRLMNTFMLDYSGEAYFFFWAQRHVALPPARIGAWHQGQQPAVGRRGPGDGVDAGRVPAG